MNLPHADARAIALVECIRAGDVTGLTRLLLAQPTLAKARIVDGKGVSRTLMHVVADWPGHLPNGAQLVATLASVGAPVDAALKHEAPHGAAETALHWAASSNDVAVLDALLDHGANIEAPGAVFTGGTAMSDAVIFAQWRAAKRLLERGASTTLWQAAALGLTARVRALSAQSPLSSLRERNNALWHACRAGQQEVAQLLVEQGAAVNWIGHDGKTALDVALESEHDALADWLTASGAQRARDVAR
jgi:uncharacterized protein